MAEALLQVNFELNVPTADYRAMTTSVADAFAKVPGLRWKVWILNEERREAGGIYLFEDQHALDAFAASDLARNVATHPAFRHVTMRQSSVMPEVTAVTRGPIGAAAHA